MDRKEEKKKKKTSYDISRKRKKKMNKEIYDIYNKYIHNKHNYIIKPAWWNREIVDGIVGGSLENRIETWLRGSLEKDIVSW